MSNFTKNTIKLITIITVLVAGYFGSITIAGISYEQWIKKNEEESLFLEKIFTEEIAKQTNPNILVKTGVREINFGAPNLAIIALQRATKLEKNYRDAWLYLGKAQIQAKNPEEAIKSLETAVKLDPIYPLTYQYLSEAYKLIGNQEKADTAQHKFESLTSK